MSSKQVFSREQYVQQFQRFELEVDRLRKRNGALLVAFMASDEDAAKRFIVDQERARKAVK